MWFTARLVFSPRGMTQNSLPYPGPRTRSEGMVSMTGISAVRSRQFSSIQSDSLEVSPFSR